MDGLTTAISPASEAVSPGELGTIGIGNERRLSQQFLKDLESVAASLHEPQVSPSDLASLSTALDSWRGYHQRLLERYREGSLAQDDPLTEPVTLFGAMDYGRLETAHTRTLAWLLNHGDHGFEFALFDALLHHLCKGRCISNIRVEKVESEYDIVSRKRKPTHGRLDIFASGRWVEDGEDASWLFVIEAKIGAALHEDQLSIYDTWLDERRLSEATTVIRVALTADGRVSREIPNHWQRLSFLELATVFRRALPALKEKSGYHYLRYYIAGVLKDVCGMSASAAAERNNPYMAVDYLKSVLPPR